MFQENTINKIKKNVPCEIQNELVTIKNLKMVINNVKCELGKEIVRAKLEISEGRVTTLMANRNIKIVQEQISQFNSMEGNFHPTGIWKIKNKILPRAQDPPMAKKDLGGNIVTAPLPLKVLYLETYKKRLEHRTMKYEHKDIFELKTLLWKIRFSEIKKVKSPKWELSSLFEVLKGLKNNQSRDPSGLIHELFKPKVIGQDLAVGLLDLLNGIKSNMEVPKNIQLANITSIYKNKGSRQELKNPAKRGLP